MNLLACVRFRPVRRLRRGRAVRGVAAAESLEARVLMTTIAGLRDVEVIGRAGDGVWYASGFDLAARAGGGAVLAREATVEFAQWDPGVAWADVRSGDFDGDGLMDLVGRVPGTGDWRATLSDGIGSTTVFAGNWNPAAGWADVSVADLSGPGDRGVQGHFINKDDLVGRASDGTWYASVSNGDGTFANAALTWWVPSAGWRDVRVADLNRDGAADLIGRTSGGAWYASLSDGGDSLGYHTVWLGQWVESAGWKDVRVLDVVGDGADDVIGRASDGSWWALTVSTAGGGGMELGATTCLGSWVEGAGWADVVVGRRTVYGRTVGGQWWASSVEAGVWTIRDAGAWAGAAGWRDVEVVTAPTWVPDPNNFFNPARVERDGIVGRTAAGEWYLLDPESKGTLLLGRWSAAAEWRDVAAAQVSAELAYAFTTVAHTRAVDTNIHIRGHRSGTSVLVEETGDGLGGQPGHVTVTYSVPLTGYRIVVTESVGYIPGFGGIPLDPSPAIQFQGHSGEDAFVNRSHRPSLARGLAGGDLLDARNGDLSPYFDSLFGGDGMDTLHGDDGDYEVEES